MPYPNEHAARLKSPGSFAKNPVWKDGGGGRFRRNTDGTIYGKVKVPATIGVIWGKVPGHAGRNDEPVPQALRFPTKNWTAKAARAWLKKSKVKPILFEAAAKPKKKASQDYSQVPEQALYFSGALEVAVAAIEDAEQAQVPFGMTLYTGQAMDHWFHGRIIIDLATLKMYKDEIPALVDHNPSRIAGVIDEAAIDKVVACRGRLYRNTEDGQKVLTLLENKFPIEASALFYPGRIVQIPEGESIEVNGQKVDGPAKAFYETRIREGSFTTFGLDDKTDASLAARGDGGVFDLSECVEDTEMAAKGKTDVDIEGFEVGEEITEEHLAEVVRLQAAATPLEGISAETPAVKPLLEAATEAGKVEGAKAARDELAALLAEENLAARPDFVIAQFQAGANVQTAKAALADVLAEENTALRTKKDSGAVPVDGEPSDEVVPVAAASGDAGDVDTLKKIFADSKAMRDQFLGKESRFLAYAKAVVEGRHVDAEMLELISKAVAAK